MYAHTATFVVLTLFNSCAMVMPVVMVITVSVSGGNTWTSKLATSTSKLPQTQTFEGFPRNKAIHLNTLKRTLKRALKSSGYRKNSAECEEAESVGSRRQVRRLRLDEM
jgi:ABC-type maltose transport system permease subunit